jgi:signal transduction histidine kinase
MSDGGRLTISTSRAQREGEGDVGARVVVAVADTGAPIEPDVAEHLFDPFLTTGIDPRTGLELAMAFGVVRQSDGEIEVHVERAAARRSRSDSPKSTAHRDPCAINRDTMSGQAP